MRLFMNPTIEFQILYLCERLCVQAMRIYVLKCIL